MTTPTPPPGMTGPQGGTPDASRPPGFVPVPPRPRPGVPPSRTVPPPPSRPAPASRPDGNGANELPGRDGDVPSRPEIRAGRVDPRTAGAVLGGLTLLLVVTLWLAWAPTGLSAWLMGGVLLAILAWAGTALWQRRGGRRPGLGRPRRPRLGGLLGGTRRPGRTGGLLGRGPGRGRDGRFLGGLGGRLGGTAGRARDASRRAASRLRAGLPSVLGGTRRPAGTTSRAGRPGGRLANLLGSGPGRASRPGGRPGTSGAGGHPSRGGTRSPAGGGGRPAGPRGTGPGGGTRGPGGTGGSRGRGGSGGGTLGAIGRGLAGILPGRGRGGGTVTATDGSSLAGPDRTKPSRDRDRDDHDVDPDDTEPTGSDDPDDDHDDRTGLPWWQRALYGLADRWQAADVRGWGEVLAEPLRRPVHPDFEVGVDGEEPPPAPPEVLEVIEDAHTPAASHEWPDEPASTYEWPSEPAPPKTSPVPRDQHKPSTRSTTVTNTPAGQAPSGPPHASTYKSYVDESTPGTQAEKYLAAASAAAREALFESEQAEKMRAAARRIEGMKGMADEYEELMAEARKQQENATRRAQLAAGFREEAAERLTQAQAAS